MKIIISKHALDRIIERFQDYSYNDITKTIQNNQPSKFKIRDELGGVIRKVVFPDEKVGYAIFTKSENCHVVMTVLTEQQVEENYENKIIKKSRIKKKKQQLMKQWKEVEDY